MLQFDDIYDAEKTINKLLNKKADIYVLFKDENGTIRTPLISDTIWKIEIIKDILNKNKTLHLLHIYDEPSNQDRKYSAGNGEIEDILFDVRQNKQSLSRQEIKLLYGV